MAIFKNSIKIRCFRCISLVFLITFFLCFFSTLFLSCSRASAMIPSNFQRQRQLLSQDKVHSSSSISSSSSSSSTIKKCDHFGKCKVQFEGDEHAVPSGPNPISNRWKIILISRNYEIFFARGVYDFGCTLDFSFVIICLDWDLSL